MGVSQVHLLYVWLQVADCELTLKLPRHLLSSNVVFFLGAVWYFILGFLAVVIVVYTNLYNTFFLIYFRLNYTYYNELL